MRTSTEVVHSDLARINAEIVIKRRKHIAEEDGPVHRFTAQTIRLAEDLACLHAPAEQHGAGDAWPVIASGVLIDGGCATEFAPNNYRYVFVQAALVNILDERAHALI